MGLIADVVAGNAVSATWGNALRDASVMQCTAAQRASIVAVEGQLVYITDEDRFYVYDGSAWVRVGWGATATGRTGAQVTTGAVSYSSGSRTTISWTSEVFDSDNFITVTSTDIVVPTGLGGLYVATLNVWGAAGVLPTSFTCMIQMNQTPYQAVMAGPSSNNTAGYPALGTDQHAGVTGMFYCAAGDIMQTRVYQNSGASISLTARLSVFRIGV